MTVKYEYVESPLGRLVVAWNDEGVVSVRLPGGERARPPVDWERAPGRRHDAIEQLDAYFAGALREFDVPVAQPGTPFQHRVWRALRDIPYGETASYTDVAKAIGAPRAVRAVGAANGRNAIPVVVPCHRVIGAGGELRGYAGGVGVKAALLGFEQGGGWPAATML